MRSHHRTAALLNMVLSCVICSIAVNWIALPNGFVVTGITGLAMTAETFTGINYALIYYGLTLAILLFTAVTLGYKEVSSILFLSILYPLVLWVLNHVQVEIILKEKLIGTGSGNLSELEKVINAQAAKGYRLHTITTSSSGSKGFLGGDRIQATMVFESLNIA